MTSPLRASALLVVAGSLLSGPLALLPVTRLAPQPPWRDAGLFVEHCKPVQSLPYLPGFLLLAGFASFAAACVDSATAARRRFAVSGAIFTGVYAAMVFTNYMLQVGAVPRTL